VIVCVAGCATSTSRPMQLRRVILYQNGIGYFERTGLVAGQKLELRFARPELDDVLKTLTVIDRLGGNVATVEIPTTTEKDRTINLGVRLGAGRAHDLLVGYAVPTPTWKAAYRVVLDDRSSALLQGWAMVNNASQEDWNGVQLTLATGAPMSFALDLHTPEYVKRPDATGRLIAPTVLGPVDAERVGAGDRDGDGILDSVDRCPDANEDLDGHDDVDGCPEPDRDRDKVVDVDDKCPAEPETYNGHEDTDGCPDRGVVISTSSSMKVLEAIGFQRNSDTLESGSLPIIDAVASALRDHPEIKRIEIGGHASLDETEAWGLAARRAGAVRAALIARGIAAVRLELVPYGVTRALDEHDTDGARARNRRVEFLILERGDTSGRGGTTLPVLDAATVQGSTRARSKPAAVAGSVRYQLTEPVSIRRGASSLVSILNKPVAGEDAFLFRPDANGPGSDRHPFRAVRLVNESGYTLEPGPIAIFAHGTFVGDSLLQRLEVGETAWIPYALDGGTTVTVTTGDDERPVRLVAIERGMVTVETTGIRTTRYTVAAGREAARMIYIRHAKTAGFVPRELPPNAIDQGQSYLVPLPLAAAKTTVLAIEERQPRRRTIAILDGNRIGEVAAYVDGAPAPIAEKLRVVIALRKDLDAVEQDLGLLRTRVGDLSQRAAEIRESIRAIDKVNGAGDLRKKLLANLAQVTADSDAVARTLGAKTEAISSSRGRLADAIRELTLDDKP